MAQKNSKTKKQLRKEKNELLNKYCTLVKTCCENPNIFDGLEPFQQCDRNGVSLRFLYSFSRDLKNEEKEFVFDLLKTNMKTLYECAGENWGWNDEDKRKECFHEEARYILVRDENDKLVAFIHIRFDVEEDEPIIYLYEIQLASALTGKGAGAFLMRFLELFANKVGLHAIKLTVFAENTGAMRFYSKLGYSPDFTSPSVAGGNDLSYEILSKGTRHRLQREE
eukprot:GCRY01002752.1.p1 GENE.GCRY01002752.1~~GCRY01002752.1.p1  ORF type:complete len:224 (-),score=35.60 GCRY01002752.1:46-717(-)